MRLVLIVVSAAVIVASLAFATSPEQMMDTFAFFEGGLGTAMVLVTCCSLFLAVASLRGALVRIGIWSLLIIAIWSFIVVGSSSILILNPETFTDRMGDYRTIWLFTAFALANAVIAINFARDRYHARR